MRYCLLLLFAVSVASSLVGCATETWETREPPRVRIGMARDDVKFFFGNPSRIEPAPGGGEDWYYRFEFSNPPLVEASSYTDPFAGRTDSVSVTVSDAKTVQEWPIHLSPEGFVIEPLPAGKFVGR